MYRSVRASYVQSPSDTDADELLSMEVTISPLLVDFRRNKNQNFGGISISTTILEAPNQACAPYVQKAVLPYQANNDR